MTNDVNGGECDEKKQSRISGSPWDSWKAERMGARGHRRSVVSRRMHICTFIFLVRLAYISESDKQLLKQLGDRDGSFIVLIHDLGNSKLEILLCDVYSALS